VLLDSYVYGYYYGKCVISLTVTRVIVNTLIKSHATVNF